MSKIDKTAIPGRIREAREAKGLTAAEVADALELHPRAWARYEREAVPWKYIGRIAEMFGVSEGWLVRGEVDPADMLREVAAAMTTQSQALEVILADLQRMNANLEKLQDSLLPNAERYRGRPSYDPTTTSGPGPSKVWLAQVRDD